MLWEISSFLHFFKLIFYFVTPLKTVTRFWLAFSKGALIGFEGIWRRVPARILKNFAKRKHVLNGPIKRAFIWRDGFKKRERENLNGFFFFPELEGLKIH